MRTAGHSVNLAILVDNIEASKAHGLAQAGLLVAEASVGHQVGLLAHLLWAGEVLSAALVVVVTPETSMAVAGLEALTEEAMEEAAMAVEVEEATGKLKEKVKAKPLVRGGRGGFFMTKRIELPEVELQIVRPFCLANCS